MEKVRSWIKGDKVIWILVVLCAMASVLAVFSASSYLANSKGVDKTVIFLEQSKSVLLGFIALFICYNIPLKWYRWFSFIIFGASVIGLILLYIPGMSSEINGAVRGLKIGDRTFQVFEFAKVGIIFYIAKAIELWQEDFHDTKIFMVRLFLPIAAVCLIVFANSVSSAILICIVCYLTIFVMDVDVKNIMLSLLIVTATVGVMFGIYHTFFEGHTSENPNKIEKLFNRIPTVESRLYKCFHPNKNIDTSKLSNFEKEQLKDETRQHEYAKAAIAEGGLFGKGAGKSTRGYSLSMAFSDFIYAFIVEEYGLAGGIFIILIYLVFFYRCIRLVVRCNESFTSALLIGLAFLITTQAFLHIFVNVRLGPITGHTLPLISHGGTAYLVLGGAFGVILSISRKLDEQDEQLTKEGNEQ